MFIQDVILTIFFLISFLRDVLSTTRPHIIIIVADDLGWNDVSFHGSNQIPTPNIDALAYNGIILNSHYVPALCTPSRASLLTGKYPTTIGMQHLVILAPEPWGLPLEETLMPEYLKRHGYSTHAIGKWHLGFHRKEYTPTYRGFDTHFGYWNGYQDYYDHTMDHSDGFESLKGYDMRRNMAVDYSSQGKYSTDAFTEEAVNIIKNHNSTNNSLFLYLAHLAPHSGNPDKPFQAPDDLIAKHSYIKDPKRRVYAAMVSKMDESVGEVVSALRDADMLDNSIILFISDNGAVTFGVHSNHGSNYPLRGLKESPWEGGVRGAAAIWSPLLNRTQRVSNQLMHVSDWLPTFYTAAGLDVSELGQIDGKDMWYSLSHDLESPRTEVFNNYDEIENYSSLRVGPWKYVAGTAQGGEVDDWFGDSGEEAERIGYDIFKVLDSKTSVAINGYLTDKQLENYGKFDHKIPDLITEKTITKLRKDSTLTCGDYSSFSSSKQLNDTKILNQSTSTISQNNIYQKLEEINDKFPLNIQSNSQYDEILACDPLKMICLFNLEKDPCERINLAKLLPDVVEILEIRLKELKKTVAKPLNTPGDPFANPYLYNNTWTNWRDIEKEDSSFSKYVLSFDEILLLLVDNIVLKVIFSPFLLMVHEMKQIFIQMIRSFLSFLTIIIFGVLSMFVLTGIQRLIILNDRPSDKKNISRKLSIFEEDSSSQLDLAKPFCGEVIR